MAYRPEWDQGPPREGGFGIRIPRIGSITRVLIWGCWIGLILNVLGSRLDPNPISHWLGLRIGNAWLLYPFATYVFPHDDGSLLHVIFNTIILWFLGESLESELGRRRFLGLAIGAAVVGGLAYILSQLLFLGSPAPVIGISGVVLGLIAYVGWAHPNQTFILFIVPVRARTLFWIMLAINVFPIITAQSMASGVAHSCHLGGLVFGVLFWRFRLDPLRGIQNVRERAQAAGRQRQQEREADADVEMDRILAKISEEGISNLTRGERKFLDERSKNLRGR